MAANTGTVSSSGQAQYEENLETPAASRPQQEPQEKDDKPKYSRKIKPKEYTPTERTSTMSFKAPLSEAKKLALLNAQKVEPPPTGIVSYITSPVRYIASVFGRSNKDSQEKVPPKQNLTPLNRPRPAGSTSPPSPLKPIEVSEKHQNHNESKSNLAAAAPVATGSLEQEVEALLEESGKQINKGTTHFVSQKQAKVSRESIEAKKAEALTNIKTALVSRRRQSDALSKPTLEGGSLSHSPTRSPNRGSPSNVKISTANKHSYKITNNEAQQDPDSPPPVQRVARDPNRPRPPPPIRVSSRPAEDSDEFSITVTAKNPRSNITTSANSGKKQKTKPGSSTSSPKLRRSSPKGSTSFDARTNWRYPQVKDSSQNLAPQRDRSWQRLNNIAVNTSNSASSLTAKPEDNEDLKKCLLRSPILDRLSFDGLESPPKEMNSSNNMDLPSDQSPKRSTFRTRPNRSSPERVIIQKSKVPARSNVVPILTPNIRDQSSALKPKPFSAAPSKETALKKGVPDLMANSSTTLKTKHEKPVDVDAKKSTAKKETPPAAPLLGLKKEALQPDTSPLYTFNTGDIYPTLKSEPKSKAKSPARSLKIKARDVKSKYRNPIMRQQSVPLSVFSNKYSGNPFAAAKSVPHDQIQRGAKSNSLSLSSIDLAKPAELEKAAPVAKSEEDPKVKHPFIARRVPLPPKQVEPSAKLLEQQAKPTASKSAEPAASSPTRTFLEAAATAVTTALAKAPFQRKSKSVESDLSEAPQEADLEGKPEVVMVAEGKKEEYTDNMEAAHFVEGADTISHKEEVRVYTFADDVTMMGEIP